MPERNYTGELNGIAQSFAYGAEIIAASNIMLAAVQIAGGEPSDEDIEKARSAYRKAVHPFEKARVEKAAKRLQARSKK